MPGRLYVVEMPAKYFPVAMILLLAVIVPGSSLLGHTSGAIVGCMLLSFFPLGCPCCGGTP